MTDHIEDKTMYRNLKRLAVLLPVTIVLIAADGRAARAGSLADALQTVTQQVKTYLDDKGENAISIGTFSGPKTGTGRAIETELVDALKEAKVNVVDELDAKWQLRGSFAIDTSGNFPIVALTVNLFDGNGAEISSFRDRFNQETAAERELVNELNTPGSSTTSAEAESSVASTTSPAASSTPPAAGGSPASTTPASDSTTSPASDAVVAANPPAASGATPQVASTNTAASSEVAASENSSTGISEGVPIDNSTDVAVLSGATADLEAAVRTATQVSATTPVTQASLSGEVRTRAREARDTALKEAIATPQFHQVNPNVIAASSSSQFHIEVLLASPAGTSAQPVPVQTKGGFPFVPLAQGDEYQIRVYNNSTFDVGVELLIDGINTLHFAENPEFKKTGKWIIKAGSSGFIKGWFVNPRRVDSFLVTPEPEGVASLLGKPQRIGNITAAFFPAWTGDQVPAFEQLLAAGRSKNLSTGRGTPQDFSGTIEERHFGTQPLSIISLRYKNPPPPSDLPDDLAPE